MTAMCQCGCGQPAPIMPKTDRAHGYVKGQPFRFVAGHQRRGKPALRGSAHPGWRGGRSVDSAGYVMVNAGRRRPVQEHILVAERALGRRLPSGAHVHHFNEIKNDNRNVNLVICQDNTYHSLLHTLRKIQRAGGRPFIDKWCSSCKRALPRMAFGIDDRCLRCRECSARLARERNRRQRLAC